MTRFEWDENKNRSNRAKHGIGFDTAVGVFADPYSIMRRDPKSDGEQRWRTIGRVDGGVLVVFVAHTLVTAGEDALIRVISARKATPRERRFMKKATGSSTAKTTLEQIRKRKLTQRQRGEIAALAALPDDKIDTSDIPEITARTGWVQNPFYRPLTRSITIRLNAPDIAVAQALSKSKGMPYQTYIKQLLHAALERELSTSRR